MPTKSAARTITRDHAAPGPAIHPGEMLLEEFLKPLGLSQVEAARQLGISVNRLNELVLGKRGVTADTALRLARRFATTPQLWMHLQADWDLRAAIDSRLGGLSGGVRLSQPTAAARESPLPPSGSSHCSTSSTGLAPHPAAVRSSANTRRLDHP